jgi:ribonuclease R
MKERIGERFEGVVTAVVGSGLFVQLDAPFVDVLVRLEDLGPDNWQVDDDALRVFAARSGERIGLGDRLIVEIVDAGILRRTIYGRRVGGDRAPAPPRGRSEANGRRSKERVRKTHDSRRGRNAPHDAKLARPHAKDERARGKPKKKKKR